MHTLTLATTLLCGAIRAVTPQIADGPWSKGWWLPRHEEKAVLATNMPAKVVFLGDSITHFWESNGNDARIKYFSEGDARMLCLGFSADRTENVLWRITEGGELDGYEAKLVCLMIGTNNAGHFPFAEEPPIDAILGIREILKTIRAKQPRATVLLLPIFPRGADADDPVRRRNDVVNREIMRFADGKNVIWVDFTDQLMLSDGRLSREFFPDLLHPSALGYEIWAAAVKPYVDAALSEGRLPMPLNRFASCVRAGAFRMDEPEASFPASRIRSEGFGEFDWYCDRLLAKRNEIAASGGAFDLVLFGDSITYGWETTGAEAYAELRRRYSVLNIGYSGDRTENLLWRGMNGELDGYAAKCVMLLVGTNNARRREDPPEQTAAGIRRILDLIAEKQPQAKVILLPVFPFGASREDPKRIINDAVNAKIRGYADGEKVIWLDFTDRFLDDAGNNVKWMPDHCHPNAEGYREIWLPAVLPLLEKILKDSEE